MYIPTYTHTHVHTHIHTHVHTHIHTPTALTCTLCILGTTSRARQQGHKGWGRLWRYLEWSHSHRSYLTSLSIQLWHIWNWRRAMPSSLGRREGIWWCHRISIWYQDPSPSSPSSSHAYHHHHIHTITITCTPSPSHAHHQGWVVWHLWLKGFI